MNSSANTLFHFTREKKALLNIIRNGLYVRYSLEDYRELLTKDSELVFPMTCFCDIPLAQTKNHTKTYGKYAIGLSKEWGMRNNINPVIYAYPNSPTTNILIRMHDELMQMMKLRDVNDFNSLLKRPLLEKITFPNKETERELTDTFTLMSHGIFDFIRYVKPYEGEIYNSEEDSINRVRFYEEREWRYTPSAELFSQIQNSREILKSKLFAGTIPKASYKPEYYKNPIKRRAINMRLAPFLKLKFNPEDIRFIIVKRQNEIPEFMEEMGKIRWNNSSEEDLKILNSRLISLEQIIEDI